jgi:hypothetical protein
MNLRRRIGFARGQDHASIQLHQGSGTSEMGLMVYFAQQQPATSNVAYGSKGDIG